MVIAAGRAIKKPGARPDPQIAPPIFDQAIDGTGDIALSERMPAEFPAAHADQLTHVRADPQCSPAVQIQRLDHVVTDGRSARPGEQAETFAVETGQTILGAEP
jgi:hypothetical protein